MIALFKFITKFGLSRGLYLACKLQIGFCNKLVIPNIKHSIKLRKKTSDIPTFWQVFVNKEYDINYGKIIPKTIIDAGANIGLFSVFMKNKFPDSFIIAIEPNKDNFSLMSENLSPYNNIVLLENGLLNKTTKAKVFDKHQLGYWGMIVEENSDGKLETITIDTIVKKYSIDFIDILKIDIE
jgi:FkbM family methyltransferase